MDFCVPDEFEQILEELPARLSLRVPADMLQAWFSGTRSVVDRRAIDLASSYARSCGCFFRYDDASDEGLFVKAQAALLTVCETL